jgi:DNA-binding NtrC family response regulator
LTFSSRTSPAGTDPSAKTTPERRRVSSGVHAVRGGSAAAPSALAEILVVASTGPTAGSVQTTLSRRGHPPLVAGSLDDGIAALTDAGARLVVLVLPLDGATGRDAIARIKEAARGVPFIVVGVDATVPGCNDAFDLGAYEHVADGLGDPSDLLATVGHALGSRRGDRHLQYLRSKEAPDGGWQSVVGQSPAIQRVLHTLRQVSTRGGTPTILITGETGTGKGFVAKCAHYNGVRRNRAFVEVNCAALPPSLMESELFGHERGSFTDAKTSRAGLFETADGGTLFLDEIGTLPLDLQAKLLKAIEEKKVRRIGSRSEVQIDVQIIAATHGDLKRRVKEGSFREDLFHRLDVVAVDMPSLRERGTDILLLAEAFLRQLCHQYGMPPRTIAEDARRWLLAYSWPGNIRELRNQIERIVLLENDDVVRAEQLGSSEDVAAGVVVTCTAGETPEVRVSLPPTGVPLATIEREIMREALALCAGNVSQAARYLSISRQTLMYRMNKHNLG